MLVARNFLPSNLVRVLPAPVGIRNGPQPISRNEVWNDLCEGGGLAFSVPVPELLSAEQWADRAAQAVRAPHPEERDPLYLLACMLEFQRFADPGAAWEIISASRSAHGDTRAHARVLLERSLQPALPTSEDLLPDIERLQEREASMRASNDLEIIESCVGCKASRDNFFCRFSSPVLRSLDAASHHTVMPAEAMLFMEGQKPRGIFVICSGTVKLSTTSKEGKVLILKQAEAGEVLGLSAAISGTNYEMSAETAVSCQLDFISRKDLMALLQNESEAGMQAAVWLSREFQGAYRDIHDLVLARSSSGKLARLLLSCARPGGVATKEMPLHPAMTHEEMAQRIGSSRETVTRLLTLLKKKKLIRVDGATLVIRDRSGLQAMAV